MVVLSFSACEFSFNWGDDENFEDEIISENDDLVDVLIADDSDEDIDLSDYEQDVTVNDEDVEDDSDEDVSDDEDVEDDSDDVSDDEDVEDDSDEDVSDDEDVEDDSDDVSDDEDVEDDSPQVDVYDGPNFLTLNSPSDEDIFSEEPIVFSGVVSPNTSKVVVTWTADEFCMGDSCTGKVLEDVYKLQNFKYGDESFKYQAKESFDNLQMGTNNYEIVAYFDDGKTSSESLTVYYHPGGAEAGKPVIYLYPEESMEVFVNVEPNNGISISDPEIADGWNVMANPNGEILNLADNKVYPYLFWEGFVTDFETPEEGFMISVDEVDSFFDEKLSILGLNSIEIADFKEFWVPVLSDENYYFITFVSQEDFDDYAPLTVEPKPDSVIRVFFDYKGFDAPVSVEEQNLIPVEREGFAVVEWGGRLYRK